MKHLVKVARDVAEELHSRGEIGIGVVFCNGKGGRLERCLEGK